MSKENSYSLAVLEHLSAATRDIAAGDKSLRSAAEHVAAAVDLGASQRDVAATVGKSAAWVNRLLLWRSNSYVASGPFADDNKAKKKRAAFSQTKRSKLKADKPTSEARAKADQAKAEAAKAKADAAKAKHEADAARANAKAQQFERDKEWQLGDSDHASQLRSAAATVTRWSRCWAYWAPIKTAKSCPLPRRPNDCVASSIPLGTS
jgi:hypothetical protein